MYGLERRRNKRATVELFISETNAGKLFMPMMANISAEGLLLESPAGLEMPDNHAPVVELMLPGVPEIVYARCKIVRQSEHGFFTRRALKFINISAVHRKLVQLYIQRICNQN